MRFHLGSALAGASLVAALHPVLVQTDTGLQLLAREVSATRPIVSAGMYAGLFIDTQTSPAMIELYSTFQSDLLLTIATALGASDPAESFDAATRFAVAHATLRHGPGTCRAIPDTWEGT